MMATISEIRTDYSPGRIEYLFAVVVLAAAPLFLSTTDQRLLTTILVWGIFAVGFNLIFGYTGMVSFGHGAFFGGGMYVAALVYSNTEITNTLVVLAIAVVVITILGLIIGVISTQARGVHFAIMTFIAAEIIHTIVFNMTDFFGGSNGISFTIPGISFIPGVFTLQAYEATPKYYVILAFTIIIVGMMIKLVQSPLGAVFKGIRENPERIHYLGFNERRFRILSFCISAAVAGIAGGLFAIVNSFVGPSILGLHTHGFVIIYTILGGAGSILGPIFGASLIIFVQNRLAAEISWWLIPVGLVFIFVMIYMPEGIGGKLEEFVKE